LAFVGERYLIVSSVLLAVYGGFGYFRIVPQLDSPVALSGIGGWFSLIILLYLLFMSLGAYRTALNGQDLTSPSSVPYISRLVREAGCSDASKVLSLDFDYYDFTSPLKTRYAIDWSSPALSGKFSSLPAIVAYMKDHGKELLLYTRDSHQLVPGLAANWPFKPEELQSAFDRLTPEGSSPVLLRLRDVRACGA
jgi:hypothetical protein